MSLRLFLIMAMGIISFHGNAQSPVYTHFNRYKVEDGLPQNFVSGLQQDRDGFLWIATRDGLARYDGREFRVFRQVHKDSSSLSSNIITNIYLDPQNLLWVFYINQQFDCFDPAQLKVCFRDSFGTVSTLMKTMKVNFFIRDRSGKFWLNTNYEGLACYDPVSRATLRFNTSGKNLRSNNNIGLAEHPNGSIYAVTDQGVEMIANPGKLNPSFYPFPASLAFRFTKGAYNKVIFLPDGRLAISEFNRVILFDSERKSFSSLQLPGEVPAQSNIISHFLVGYDQLLHVEAAGNVYRLEKDNRFTWLFQSSNANLIGSAKSLLVDQSGVLWLGTNAAGLYKIDLQSIPISSNPYKRNFVVDQVATLQGLSVSSMPGQFTRGTWGYAFRYCYDARGRLFLTYSEAQSAPGSGKVFVYRNNSLKALPSRYDTYPMRGLGFTPSGALVASDRYGNISKWTDLNSLPEYTNTCLELTSQTGDVADIEVYEKETWIATEKDGLYRIANGKIVKHYVKGERSTDLPGNQLTDLCRDPFNPKVFWIGTLGQGLIKWNTETGTERVYTTVQGLANNTIYSIVPDATHHLWISTNKGISRINIITGTLHHFDARDGLISNEFNRFHHFRFPDGRIAFGSLEGSSVFDPMQFEADSFATRVAFTRLYINNIEKNIVGINDHRQLVLPFNQNFLAFEFAGLQFNQPGKIQYRYMLKGYDKDWINAGTRNLATYTRLPPGRYTFQVNASNTGGQWSSFTRDLSIRIRPPFWATWWAYMVYGLVALVLIRIYWRYRVNRIRLQNEIALEHNIGKHLREVDEIKSRFFANITHEFRTPLTLILTPLEKLEKDQELSPIHQLTVMNAHRNAEKLLSLINQLLDISKIEAGQMKVNLSTGELDKFVQASVLQFAEQARGKNIALNFDCHEVSGHFLFDEEKWEKILGNLLGNAIKFTPVNGEIRVSLREKMRASEPVIELKVSDTGPGIPVENLNRIFDRFYMVDDSHTRSYEGTGIGLSLVKEMTELMGGSVQVDSTPGKGSTFTIELPVKKAVAKKPGDLSREEMKEASLAPHAFSKEEPSPGPLLLVVEDNEELRSFISQNLSMSWRTLQAADGNAAWDILLKELPDIVISDVMMPGMNGFDLCRKAKNDKRTAHISFILLTAKAAHISRVEGLEAGADEYITKPFHFDELVLRVKNLARQQESWRAFLQEQLLPEKPSPRLPNVNDIFLQHLYQFLDERLDEPSLDVEFLAKAMAMSRRTLNRKLKALLNISSNELIRRYRLQKAAIMLASGQTVAQTAYSVGFETPSYFTQCFKEQYGQTPSEFAAQKTA